MEEKEVKISMDDYLKLKRSNEKKKAIIVIIAFLASLFLMTTILLYFGIINGSPKENTNNNIEEPTKIDETLSNIVLNENNQEVSFNGKTIKLKLVDGIVYLNNKPLSNESFAESNAYIANEFILFESQGQSIGYRHALNRKEELIEIIDSPTGAYTSVSDIHLDNGKITAKVTESQEIPDENGENIEESWYIEFVYVYEKDQVKAIRIS